MFNLKISKWLWIIIEKGLFAHRIISNLINLIYGELILNYNDENKKVRSDPLDPPLTLSVNLKKHPQLKNHNSYTPTFQKRGQYPLH